MSGGALIVVVLGTLFFPGLGQGIAYRRARMIGFAAAAVLTTFALLWSVWFLPIMLAVRVASMVDALLLLRGCSPPANRVLAAIAIVIGAVGGGAAKMCIESFKIPSSSMAPTIIVGDHIFVDRVSKLWRPIERGELVVFTQPCAKVAYVKRVIAVAGDSVEVRCSVLYVNGTPIPRTLLAPSTTYRDYDEINGQWFSRPVARYRETHGGRAYDVFHGDQAPEQTGHAPSPRDFPGLDYLIAPSCDPTGAYGERGLPQPLGKLVHAKPTASACEPQAHFVVPEHALFVMGDNRSNANDSRVWGAVATDAVIGRVTSIWLSAPPGRDRDWSRFGPIE